MAPSAALGVPGLVPGAVCSAHWLKPLPGVGDGNVVVEAFYAQGTRFIDVGDPRRPVQVGYFAPRGAVAAAPAGTGGGWSTRRSTRAAST
jgi:hypothetical protein